MLRSPRPGCARKATIIAPVCPRAYARTTLLCRFCSKPENLLCRPDGSGLKVADFGQARNTRSRPPYTPYVGTRWYRSPEEVLDLPAYNSPVDVWAAGAIFAELFAGRPVFPGATAAAQVFAIAALLGPVTPSLWPDGARQCAACGIRTDVGAGSFGSSSSSGGAGGGCCCRRV